MNNIVIFIIIIITIINKAMIDLIENMGLLELTLFHYSSKDTEFFRGIKANEIHASITAKVATIEPIPVFKFMPWLTPWKKIIVILPFHVRNPYLKENNKRRAIRVIHDGIKDEQNYSMVSWWVGYLLFLHNSRSGRLRRGLPSGPILAGFWAMAPRMQQARIMIV